MSGVDDIDVGFCFYDDPDYRADADRDSRKLRNWHQQLWSKPLPSGRLLQWNLEPGTSCLTYDTFRVSSDTIATTHANYQRAGAAQLWAGMTRTGQDKYERAFYTIGGSVLLGIGDRILDRIDPARTRSPDGADSDRGRGR